MEEEYVEKLKNVFDVCDTNGDGYITVDHLKDLARNHFGADSDEEIVGIIQLLDPEGRGRVNFAEFKLGVQHILDVQAALKQQSTPKNSEQEEFNSFSFEDISPLEAKEASEASAFTYNEYDTNTDEDGQGLLIDLSTPEISRRDRHNDFTDEDNFEDYGVGGDIESDTSDHAHSLPCSSCEKSRRRGNASTAKHLRQRGAHRRISSAAYASQLQRNARQEEEMIDDDDDSYNDLSDRVKFLEKQLLNLSEEKQHNAGLQHKLKDENNVLIRRVHSLEDQMRESNEKIQDEQRKFKDVMERQQREKEARIDFLSGKLHLLETENSELRKLKTENERLRKEKLEIQDRLSAVREDYNTVAAENDDMKSKFDRERIVTGQLLDELQKELEELRKYKIDTENLRAQIAPSRTRVPSLSDSNSSFSQLQGEMLKLRETNRHLQEENEELNAQLLTRCVNEGKHILQQEGNSLADELDHLTKEELMKKITEQMDSNYRLKQYVDKILLTILEKNPSLLEVT